jgi:hypothetical protein
MDTEEVNAALEAAPRPAAPPPRLQGSRRSAGWRHSLFKNVNCFLFNYSWPSPAATPPERRARATHARAGPDRAARRRPTVAGRGVGPQGEISGAEAKLRAALVQKDVLEREVRVLPPPPPPSRTKWTRLVHPSVLTGHVSSLSPQREVRVAAPRARCPGARAPERALRACGRGPGACVSRAGGCPEMSAPVASVVRRRSLTARGGRRLR